MKRCHYCGAHDGDPVRDYRDPDTGRNVPAHLTCWLRRLPCAPPITHGPMLTVGLETKENGLYPFYWEHD